MDINKAKEILNKLVRDSKAVEFLEKGDMQGFALYIFTCSSPIFGREISATEIFQAVETSGVDYSAWDDIIINPAKTNSTLYDFYSEDTEEFIEPRDFYQTFKVISISEDYGFNIFSDVPRILSKNDAKQLQCLLADEMGETIFATPFHDEDIIGNQPCYFIKVCEILVGEKRIPGYAAQI